jgi:hypothetical protein
MPLSDEDMYVLLGPPRTKQNINYMGYTHYWYYKPSNTKGEEEGFTRATQRISAYANYLQAQGINICGPFGTGKAEIDPQHVRFNGDKATGRNHETFSVQLGEILPNEGFNFCKTARKPYDTLVCLSLLALQEELGEDTFHYASDGNDGDWGPAYEIYETFHSTPAPRLAKED